MLRQTPALPIAVLVMRRPIDEIFGVVMAPAARSHRIAAEVPGLACAQTLQANFPGGREEYHQIEVPRDVVTPALERSAQHPVRAWQENFLHQPETFDTVALPLIRRHRRLPEIVVGVVMRDGEGVGPGAAGARGGRGWRP